jgi:creatinine amidohydrolase/Fe(II)-dependent formamide hydrolase-like protein
MNTREIAALQRRGAIALLPVGCFEMHGVQAALGCDTLIAEAACRVLAEVWDAVIFPPVHYTYPGASTPWPGTVAILPRETFDYVVAVLGAIMKNGFKKVVLVNFHFPNEHVIQLAMRQVFETTGEIPLNYQLNYLDFYQAVKKATGADHGESAMLLAALQLLGRQGDFDPASTAAEKLDGPEPPFPVCDELRRRQASAPCYFTKPNQHVGRYPGLTLADAPKMAKLFREMILSTALGLPEAYDQLQKEMRQAIKDAPWSNLP